MGIFDPPRMQKKQRGQSVRRLSELLDEAKRLNINVSETLERRLRSLVRAEQEKRWLEENKEAFSSINAFIEKNGLLSNRLRYRSGKK